MELKEDPWDITDEIIETSHNSKKWEFINETGIEEEHYNLDLNSKEFETWLEYCNTCGWWRVIRQFLVSAEIHQLWTMFFGCSGTLKNLDITDINIPIEEATKYLIARYDDRFSINPKLFEDVVGNVFKDIGYNVHVTGYSNDGGIDVVLGNSSQNFVGVQVKRYKNKIKVEQIRAFAGALLLNGYNNGIFVTTSDYQPGAIKAAEQFKLKTLPIKLMNSDKFYDALKISQKSNSDPQYIIDMINDKQIEELKYYGWSQPNASL
ncbi:restriction endonuclease [Seonamhaeicola marinus]|uniref:restriction endonuclease n=1 Tax=Seonamhaeicola marinus TaxID=1912246 RepID=UPI001CA37EF5|nr:restriction endonuclease [Seonamhaeicola marinus]